MGVCQQTPVECFPKNAGRHKRRSEKGRDKRRDVWSPIGDFLREQHKILNLPTPSGRGATNLQQLFDDLKDLDFEGTDIPSGETNDDVMWYSIGNIEDSLGDIFFPKMKKKKNPEKWSVGKPSGKNELFDYYFFDAEGEETILTDAEFYCDKTTVNKQEGFTSSAEEVIHLKESLEKININNNALKKENEELKEENNKFKKENEELKEDVDCMHTEEDYVRLEDIIIRLKGKLVQYGEDVDNYDY
jgi:hypothetical protein